MMNNWIIFDTMGVIFQVGDDTNELLIPYIQQLKPQVDKKYIQSAYLQASLGQIATLDFWRLMGLDDLYPQVEQTYLDTCLKIDPQFKEIATELSREHSLAILSNDVKEWSLYLQSNYGLNKLCRKAVISGEVGYRKPSLEIYKILLERLSTPSEHCVFVDDRVPNLLTAIKVGITPVWYQRNSEEKNKEIQHSIQNFTELPELVRKIFAL